MGHLNSVEFCFPVLTCSRTEVSGLYSWEQFEAVNSRNEWLISSFLLPIAADYVPGLFLFTQFICHLYAIYHFYTTDVKTSINFNSYNLVKFCKYGWENWNRALTKTGNIPREHSNFCCSFRYLNEIFDLPNLTLKNDWQTCRHEEAAWGLVVPDLVLWYRTCLLVYIEEEQFKKTNKKEHAPIDPILSIVQSAVCFLLCEHSSEVRA